MHKVFCIFSTLFVFQVILNAQSERKYSRSEYIEMYQKIAIKEMARSGIPASITLAQGCLESGDGNSRLALKGNNHFGIKCHDWEGNKIHHDDDRNNECFRKYQSVEESYRDHTDFLMSKPRYAELFEIDSKDYKAWARGLKRTGYATSPTYAEALIKIIEDYKLFLLDEGVEIRRGGNQTTAKKSKNDIQNKRETFENNRVKYIVVKEGETLESITNQLKLLPWELTKYNEIPENTIVNPGQWLYIQPKRNKAEAGKNIHVVKEGETLFTISQLYAIKQSSLATANQLPEGTEVQAGMELDLRSKGRKKVITEILNPAPEIEKEDKMIFELDPGN